MPKTGPAALLVALFAFQWVFICFGSLVSATVRSWIFEPSPALEKAAAGLWLGGIAAIWLMLHALYQAWQLFQQASQ